MAFRVHIPRKKAKNGFQQFRLCEADTGYCWDFEYYAANEKEPYDRVEINGYDVRDFTLPAKIVLHLMEPLLNQGYTLGVDNLYSDPRFFDLLLENGIVLRGNTKYGAIPWVVLFFYFKFIYSKS